LEGKQSELNIPNILTVFRLCMVPVVVILIAQDQMITALVCFLIACGTDLLDGYIARKYGLVTKLGIWLDPLADKLMALCVLITFTCRGIFPLWVTLIVLVKELLMLIGGLIVLRKGYSTPSNRFGKAAALLLNVCLGSGFLYQYFAPYYLYATYIVLAVVVAAFIQYAVKNGHLVFAKPAQKEE